LGKASFFTERWGTLREEGAGVGLRDFGMGFESFQHNRVFHEHMRAERAMSLMGCTERIRSNRDMKQHPSPSDTIRWLPLVVHDGNLGRAQIAFPYNAREVDENAVDHIKLCIKADLGKVAQKCNNPTGTNWRYLTLVWEPSDCNWPRARSALQYKDRKTLCHAMR
jgi:hypothetical protein